MTQSERMKKYWEQVKAGKKPAPAARHKKPYIEMRTSGKYGPSMRKSRKLVVRLDPHSDTISIREEFRRKEDSWFTVPIHSCYHWMVHTTVLANLKAKKKG